MHRQKLALLVLALMSLPLIQNCGVGGGGGLSDVVIGEQLINDGWANIRTGHFATAQTHFQQAIAQPLTDAQRTSAHNGLGWALARQGKILESIPVFEVAAHATPPSKEAKVGLAGALIWRQQTIDDYRRAAELLGNMPPERFSTPHAALALSSARVHALAAIAYALSGDMVKARTHINKAAALDSMMVGTTVDRVDEAFTLLGWREPQTGQR